MKLGIVLPLVVLPVVACASGAVVPPASAGSGAVSRVVAEAPVAATQPAVRQTAPSIYLKADPVRLSTSVLREANLTRRAHGAGTLVVDRELTRAARRYAQELARRREIEHVSATPGRRTFRERFEAEGGRARLAGENLARMSASPQTMPSRVVKAWMESPGHRVNLLDRGFARTGVGVWMGEDGVWYVVQLYATAS